MTSIAALSNRQDPLPGSVTQLASAYRRALEAQGKSPRTIETYLEALARLDAFLVRSTMPRLIALLQRDHLDAFIADVQSNQSPATAVARYRALQSFFRWCEEDHEIDRNPMTGMRPPAASRAPTAVSRAPSAVIPQVAVARLLRACEGREFRDLRDMAIVRLFIDTGLRRNELAMLRVDDVDVPGRIATAPGRGNTVRTVRFTPTTARAVDRYVRVGRAGHPEAGSPALWLGHGGPMTGNGIYQAIEARTARAGIERIQPHRFRQSFALEQLRGGTRERADTGSDTDRAVAIRKPKAASLTAAAEPSAPRPRSVAEPPSVVEPPSLVPPNLPVDLVAELLHAMRVAAAQARTATLDEVRNEGSSVIERIEARSSAEAAEMRRRADEETARVDDWAATEMARIRDEAAARADARRAQFDGQLERRAGVVEKAEERVRDRIAAFEAEVESFFDGLAREGNLAAFAARAAKLPSPPFFALLDAVALDATAGDALAGAAESAEPRAAAIDLDGGRAVGREASVEHPPNSVSAGAARAHGTAWVTTLVVARGMADVARVAQFKRHLGRLAGVRQVGVSSGRDGSCRFEVTHDTATALRELIPTLPDFAARVVEGREGMVEVSVLELQS